MTKPIGLGFYVIKNRIISKKKFRIAAIVGLPGFDRDTYVLSSLRNFKLSELGNEGKKN